MYHQHLARLGSQAGDSLPSDRRQHAQPSQPHRYLSTFFVVVLPRAAPRHPSFVDSTLNDIYSLLASTVVIVGRGENTRKHAGQAHFARWILRTTGLPSVQRILWQRPCMTSSPHRMLGCPLHRLRRPLYFNMHPLPHRLAGIWDAMTRRSRTAALLAMLPFGQASDVHHSYDRVRFRDPALTAISHLLVAFVSAADLPIQCGTR